MASGFRSRPTHVQTTLNTEASVNKDTASHSSNAFTHDSKHKDEDLWKWEDLPIWQKDNEHIHSGYRPPANSYVKSLRSILHLHNETLNIHTHLFAALWMLFLAIILRNYAAHHYVDASNDDNVVFTLFFLGGFTCFAFSTAYHIFSNPSRQVSEFFHKLDFLGIIFVTSGCFPPGLWYTFPCADRQTKMWLIGVDLPPCGIMPRTWMYANIM